MDSKINMDKKNSPRGPSKASVDSANKTVDYGNKKRNGWTKEDRNDHGKRTPTASSGRSGQRFLRTREKMDRQVIGANGGKRNELRQHRMDPSDWSQDNQSKSLRRKKASYQSFNKDGYLRQSCQFVVHSGIDYSMYETDPDMMVEWDEVEEVRMHKTDPPNCPICLYPPIAGKITKCGHVFCSQCILHYLALTDYQWRLCPICDAQINQTDLRSVVIIRHPEFNVGDEICMALMHRERDSIVSDLYMKKSEASFTFSTMDDISPNSMLILASKQQILKEIIAREFAELTEQLKVEKDEPEACFIQQALLLLKERKSTVNAYKVAQKTTSLSQTVEALSILTLKERPIEDGNMPKTVFQFYQEAHGMHIYLTSINIQMLVKEFGSLEKCPQYIRGVILQKELEAMTDHNRHRTRFLGHLSSGCPYETVEVQFTDPIISQDTMDQLRDRLEKRAKFREHKREKEKAAETKARRKADEAVGKNILSPQVHIGSLTEFPAFNEEEFPAACSHPINGENSTLDSGFSRPSFAEVFSKSPPASATWVVHRKVYSSDSEDETKEPSKFALDDFLSQARIQPRRAKQRKKKLTKREK